LIRVKSHITRAAIFFAGIVLIAAVYLAFTLPFLTHSVQTEGIVTRNYVHGINKSDFGSTISAEISFYAGDSVITFLGPEGQQMDKGTFVPVLYDPLNPQDARIYTFSGYWLHGLLWCLLPLIFWIAACFSIVEVSRANGDV
jgi:hypothetical protein